MKKEKRKSAFTLAELMVVIAIIAILATVSILGYKSFIKRETINSALTEADQVREVITSQVIASTDGFVQIEYDGGSATTQFTYDGGVLQIATFPPSYVSYANNYIGTGGKERSDCFDAVMRQRFPSLAGVPGLLTIDGSDIWYHKASYDELYEYVTKNGLQDVKFDPSQPFFKDDVAVNILSMEYVTTEESGAGEGGTDTTYKLSIDKYEVFVPLGGKEYVNYTVTPATAEIKMNGGTGMFTVSDERHSSGTGVLTISGVQAGSTYLQLSVGNINRAIKVNVGESGKHIIRVPIQNSPIAWDKEEHFPKDTDWIYWGDYTYVIDGKNVKASEIFELDESTIIYHSELGAYQVKFQFKDAYKDTCCWSTTFKSDPVTVTWKIAKRSLSIPTQKGTLEYKEMDRGRGFEAIVVSLLDRLDVSATIQEPEWNGLVIKDENGNDFDLIENRIVKYSLKRDNENLYQRLVMMLDGTSKPREHIGYSDPGVYTDATFEILPEYTDFYCWMDEQGKALNNPVVVCSWQIHKILISDPTMPRELKYTASNPPSTELSDYFSGDDLTKAKNAKVEITIEPSGTNPNESIIKFKIDDEKLNHYGFRSNEKDGVLTYPCVIEKESIPVPVFTGDKDDYTYSSSKDRTVTFHKSDYGQRYDTNSFDLDVRTWGDAIELVDSKEDSQSETSARSVGIHYVVFKIKNTAYYSWDDSKSEFKAYGPNKEYVKVPWEIYKISQSNISAQDITLTTSMIGTTEVKNLKEGATIKTVSCDNANFIVENDGTTITVTAKYTRDDNNDRVGNVTVEYNETQTYSSGKVTFKVTQKVKEEQSISIGDISLTSSTTGTTVVNNLKDAAKITEVTVENKKGQFVATYEGLVITVEAKQDTNYTQNSAVVTVKYGSTANYKAGSKTFNVTQKAKPAQNVTIKDVTIDGGQNSTGSTTVSGLKESPTVTATSSDTNKFTASVSTSRMGTTTVTVTAKQNRSDDDVEGTITVNYGETTNYAAGSKTFKVTQKGKSEQSVSINDVTIDGGQNSTGSTTVKGLQGSPTISVTSSDTNKFTASVSTSRTGTTTVTVTAKQNRSDDDVEGTITVNYTATNDYKAGSKTFKVTQKGKENQSVTIDDITMEGTKQDSTTVEGLKENAAITDVSVSNKNGTFTASTSTNKKGVTTIKITAGQDAPKDNTVYSATVTVSYESTANYKAGSETFTVTQKKESTCVTGDTLITLADGSTKRIDELTYDDELLTYNLDTGVFEGKQINKVYYHGDNNYRIMNLKFSNGQNVETITEHGFLNRTKHTYSQINEENYKEFINDEFMLEDGSYTKLVDVEFYNKSTGSYSIITAYNSNFVVNGFVSLTGGRHEVFEIGEDMKYDAIKKQADIDNYGLFDYSQYEDYISEKDFYELSCPEYKVLLEKGYIDEEYIITGLHDLLIDVK